MSIALSGSQPTRRHRSLRSFWVEGGSVVLGVALLVWSLLPIYNIFLVALDPDEGEIEFDGNLWPPEPSLEGFRSVITQQARYLEDFWHQFGNGIAIGFATAVLTVLIGSLASFGVQKSEQTGT